MPMFEQDFLEPIDLYFADSKDQDVRALQAAVMHSARLGHLCMDLKAVNGSDEWIQAVKSGAAKNVSSPYITTENNLIYLTINHRLETDVISELKRLIGPSPLPKMKAELTDEQQAAFDLVRSENLSIIEGGPGTGKTYLVSELVKSFGKDTRIILTAPTGKAAARMKEKNPQALCGTLHAILGIKSSKNLAEHRAFIQAELIVVDEASMIDVKMLRTLLRSLPTGQRIVFFG
jgi:exodeoxyribonuclease V alpha subunit